MKELYSIMPLRHLGWQLNHFNTSSTPVSFYLKATHCVTSQSPLARNVPHGYTNFKGLGSTRNPRIVSEHYCFCLLFKVENFPTIMALSSKGSLIPLTKRIFPSSIYIPIFNLILPYLSNNFWDKSLNQEGKSSAWLKLYLCWLPNLMGTVWKV